MSNQQQRERTREEYEQEAEAALAELAKIDPTLAAFGRATTFAIFAGASDSDGGHE
jgi:hypothetical protein